MCILGKDCPEPCCETSVSKLNYHFNYNLCFYFYFLLSPIFAVHKLCKKIITFNFIFTFTFRNTFILTVYKVLLHFCFYFHCYFYVYIGPKSEVQSHWLKSLQLSKFAQDCEVESKQQAGGGEHLFGEAQCSWMKDSNALGPLCLWQCLLLLPLQPTS